jgi:aryl-alcohol dehydrogenase-like predicted oxidoreductase
MVGRRPAALTNFPNPSVRAIKNYASRDQRVLLVKAGKARYFGASSVGVTPRQDAALAEVQGWARLVSMQDQYNVLQREEEREMFGLLVDQGVGSMP